MREDAEKLAELEGGSFWETTWRAEFGDEDEAEEEVEEGEEGEQLGPDEEGEEQDAEANFAAVLQASCRAWG